MSQKMIRKEIRISEKRLQEIEKQMAYFDVENQASYLRELLDIGFLVKQKQMEGTGARLSELEIDGHIASIISQELLLIKMGIGSQLITSLSQEEVDRCREVLKSQHDC
jgi:hypothetical protein